MTTRLAEKSAPVQEENSPDACAPATHGAVAKPSRDGALLSRYKRELVQRAAADRLTQEAMEALSTTVGWQRWLRIRSYLGTHALHNQFLIAHQRPSARRLAGTRRLQRLGYAVRPDETPIRVWAHVPALKSALRAWERSGSSPDEKPEGELHLVSVFDQDQVTPLVQLPDDDPDSAPHSSEAHNLISALGQLIKFASEIGTPVNFEPIAGPVRGCHEPGTGAIVIDASPDFPPAARARRLIYELASVLIDEDPRRRFLKMGAQERETVSGSVEYCVSMAAGLRRSDNPIPVPAEWAMEGAIVAVGYAALVDRVARRLETALRSGLDGIR
jgi:hypothetical protein